MHEETENEEEEEEEEVTTHPHTKVGHSSMYYGMKKKNGLITTVHVHANSFLANGVSSAEKPCNASKIPTHTHVNEMHHPVDV